MAYRKRGLTEEEIRKLLQELSDQSDEISDDELNATDESDHLSHAEISDDQTDILESERESVQPASAFVSRNKTEWCKVAPATSKERQHNLMKLSPGPTRYAIQRINEEPVSAMELFLTHEMMGIILEETNREMKRISEEKNKKYTPVSAEELEAYIGLIILAGVYKSAGGSLKELWSEQDGREIFRATMSLQRFEIIRQYLRFDNKESRASRRRQDKLAPIRLLFDMFVAQYPKMFIPYENLTVRGKCPFRQYIPSKPRGKYGIKLWLMSDVKTAYVYAGKPSGGERDINQGRNVVLRLVKSIEGTARNITVDNFFTDYTLADELLKNRLTVVGTIRKNKPFIPHEFQSSRDRKPLSSLFGFQKDKTLVSYVPKKK